VASRRRRASEAVRTKLERARARLEHERERHYTVALGFIIADRSRQTAASVLAGALAFRFFLTLLPLTLVAVVGLGYMESAGDDPTTALKQFGIKGALASTINHSAELTNPGRAVVLVLGVFGVLSGVRTTTRTLRAIHALAWGIPVVRWRRSAAAGLVFLGGLVVAVASGSLAARARAEAGIVPGVGASAGWAGVIAAMWLGASWFLPHSDEAGLRSLVPGAILVGVGLAALQVFTAYLFEPRLSHSSALYGALGVAFVLLGWLYLVGRLLVAAPLLNRSLLEHRARWASRPEAHDEALGPGAS
jgi:uncharacterized BrkB/YihY/UPF0761 family membrane protein